MYLRSSCLSSSGAGGSGSFGRWDDADVRIPGERFGPLERPLGERSFHLGLQAPGAAAQEPLPVAAAGSFTEEVLVLRAERFGAHLLHGRQFGWHIDHALGHVGVLSLAVNRGHTERSAAQDIKACGRIFGGFLGGWFAGHGIRSWYADQGGGDEFDDLSAALGGGELWARGGHGWAPWRDGDRVAYLYICGGSGAVAEGVSDGEGRAKGSQGRRSLPWPRLHGSARPI